MSNQETIEDETNHDAYLNATGDIAYGMTNDYIFRIVFQENKLALKGLICAILGLKDEEIADLKITNEVKVGEAITDKEYRMDIVVELNDSSTLDLEMQINNYNNWQYRSLCYLCREFDSLDHGVDYSNVKTAYQIGFLDFTLFEDHPEFFSMYQMRNVRDGHVYTDRFNLIVISLNQEKLATDDDRARGIDKWVRLLKSKTWEELRMVANDDKYMTSAAETVYVSNQDCNVVKVAREREDFLKLQAHKDATIGELQNELTNAHITIAEQNSTITEQDALIKKYREKYGDI